MIIMKPESIEWDRYPKLRKIFEHRPIENIYWIELLRLLHELHRKGYIRQVAR